MWGMIAKITAVEGKREEMIAILRQSAAKMPGCISYVVAKDAAAEHVLWVTEVWQSQPDHAASLGLRQVQEAMPRARPLIADFERIAVTTPVCDAAADA
jgi:quinol monooxygenase YgiN